MKTYGFDYCFSLSLPAVNRILQQSLQGVVMKVQYSTFDQDSGINIELAAMLSPWRVVRGGQNSQLDFEVPFREGALKLSGTINETFDLSGVSTHIRVRLGWVGPGTAQSKTGGGSCTQLVFDPSGAKDSDEPGYVSTIEILDPQKRLKSVATGLLKGYMAQAIYANKEALRYILASVNPSPANVAGWLAPKRWDYFYTQTPENAALCFICMLEERELPPPGFEAAALRPDTDSLLLVSQEVFYGNVVLPGLAATFPGAGFTLTPDDVSSRIANTQSFNLGNVTAWSFALTPSDDGNGVKTGASGGGPLSFLFGQAHLPDASYSWSLQTVNPLRFSNPEVSFAEDPNPVTSHDQSIPWYDWLLLGALGIANAGDLAIVITDAVNDFYDQVNAVGMQTINNEFQNAVRGSIVNAGNLLRWGSGSQATFHPTTAGLDGAFYLRGNVS